MTLHHLRRNAVAYLALVVALGTGTAYAADQVANGSVTAKKLAKNSVTSPKIKKSAVRSADIKDGSVAAADLAPGLLPPGLQIAGETVGGNPVAAPDSPDLTERSVTLSGPSTVYVRWFAGSLGLDCGDGLNPQAGLYLDDAPLAGTMIGVANTSQPRARELVWSGRPSVGTHTFRVGLNCLTDDVVGTSFNQETWTVLVQPD